MANKKKHSDYILILLILLIIWFFILGLWIGYLIGHTQGYDAGLIFCNDQLSILKESLNIK